MEERENPKEKLIKKENKMNKVRNNLRSQVQILEKSIEEQFLCCCIDYDLTISEYKTYINLKKKVIPSYDPQNPIHENSLSQLFSKSKNIIFKDKESSDLISNATVTTKNSTNVEDEATIWRKIGFQTGNPRTDFRAGGIFSLDLMNYFANNYEKEYINMISEDYFPFALVCIRLSYLLRIYLFLISSEEIRINLKYQKNILSTRKELKYFCYFLDDNNNLLFDIACIGLRFIYHKFLEKKKIGNKEVNYLIIDPIIISSIHCLKNTLNSLNINDDFISKLQKNYRENYLKTLE